MIEFKGVTHFIGSKKILCNVSFSAQEGQLVCIVGESGSGKTTMLKMINRLIQPTTGSIYIDGQNIKSANEIFLRRKIGYVIQHTGLFRHMTIQENIELIPRLQKKSSSTLLENTKKLMSMVHMNVEEFLHKYPNELSGGQQQRIGVARAFATNPQIILMDEPFSALDPITRSKLQDELIELQKQLKKTIIFVTHDMEEALKMADQICIMRDD